ncbi:MAG TPA: efflux RND transporter permease subunit, partial [Chthoniobacteraceae bacterium]|nr:efflux RND transporter permease subunit [Chthoniobacteraceae bacterium]
IQNVIMNIGLPTSGINLAFSDSATISPADGEILIALNSEKHGPVAKYMQQLRIDLHKQFPDMTFYFASPDIVSQILNFGIPAPIDVQVVGHDPDNYRIAQEISKKISGISGAVDVRVHQVVNGPELRINVDRTRAEQIGLTQQSVASTMLVSLASSGQASPNFWLNFKTGVNYTVAVQTPQYNMDTLQELENTPVAASGTFQTQLLGNLATIERRESPVIVDHYDVQPVFDVLAATQNRDLRGVANDVQKVLDEYNPKPSLFQQIGKNLFSGVGLGDWADQHGWFKTPPSKLPRGTTITVRGQVQSMNESFSGLFKGIAFAIVLVYFLMVINFQSWTDPFIIIMALPGALCGIIWILIITGTTINVPSLMGAIMAIGVATSNSILLVTFANDERREGKNAYEAALSAGYTRLRPIVMTALAMIIGMLPMSLGLGEGGEQNAPLGRAVIGGLVFATFATLFFVPVVYSVLRRKEIGEDADEKFRREAGETEETGPAGATA